jgi:hypothetical protein
VVVLDVLLDRPKQRRLSEEDHSAETFLLDRSSERANRSAKALDSVLTR